MKYYQLTKDLPTFEKGELFYISDYGNLISCKDKNVIAYTVTTLTKFPNILEDWFREVPAPERDSKTKYAFIEYISDHREERFFQAVRNFSKLYLDGSINFILAGPTGEQKEGDDLYADTFYWECDDMLKEEE